MISVMVNLGGNNVKSIKIMLTAMSLMLLIAILGIGSLTSGNYFTNFLFTAFWLFVLIAVIMVIGLFQKQK
jgi:hypothetical protein